MAKKKRITQTMEDYLEVMYNLEKEKKIVRVKDIAKKMNVRMPTVTNMLKNLSECGLVNYERYEYIELTDEGKKIGAEITRRHNALKKFLMNILGIDEKKAEDEACRMEHAVSGETLNRFVDFMEFIEVCPRAGKEWLTYFQDFLNKKELTCLKFKDSFEKMIKEYSKKIKG